MDFDRALQGEERDHGAKIVGLRQGLLGLSDLEVLFALFLLVLRFLVSTWGLLQSFNELVCRLAGRVAVITDGASGIGKATATKFVRNDAKVVIADVQDDLGHTVAAELGGPDTVCRVLHPL